MKLKNLLPVLVLAIGALASCDGNEVPTPYPLFQFNGQGGRDSHPMLMLITSHDGNQPAVQVNFRLKSDHSKTSSIYVTHN